MSGTGEERTEGGGGRLLVLSGPSGAGKTSVARALLRDPRYGRAVTATTRPPREGERDGADYHFLTEGAFRAGLAKGEFLEHALVYGHLYGTPRRGPEEVLRSGRSCVLVVDVQGARSLRTLGLEAYYAFVVAPSPEELRRRLVRRGLDGSEEIDRRLRAAEAEMGEAKHFDLVLVNDDVEACTRRLAAAAGLAWNPDGGD